MRQIPATPLRSVVIVVSSGGVIVEPEAKASQRAPDEHGSTNGTFTCWVESHLPIGIAGSLQVRSAHSPVGKRHTHTLVGTSPSHQQIVKPGHLITTNSILIFYQVS